MIRFSGYALNLNEALRSQGQGGTVTGYGIGSALDIYD